MNDYNMNLHVGDNAYRRWREQVIFVSQRNLRPWGSKDDVQTLRTNVNRCICDFCAGPCGGCTRKHSEDPYACEDCPQDHLGGLTACHTCPYAPLERPELLRELDD